MLQHFYPKNAFYNVGKITKKIDLLVIEMNDTIIFEKNNVKDIVLGLGLEIDSNKRIINEGDTTHCHVCNTEITIKNLGNISKGSKIFYCDKPGCFAYRSVERLIGE